MSTRLSRVLGYAVLARVRYVAGEGQRACRKIFGVPEYDAYLAHFRTAHPGEVPLNRGDFLAWALERKHAGTAARCC
jgi:uncharacterized short protein YbdD (DUF466 family)